MLMQNKFVAVSTALILAAFSSAPSPRAATNDSMTPSITSSQEVKEEKYKQIVKASTEAFIARDVTGSAKAVSNIKGENLRYIADQDWAVV